MYVKLVHSASRETCFSVLRHCKCIAHSGADEGHVPPPPLLQMDWHRGPRE